MSAPDPSGDDLDALLRDVDPDRWLSSRFIADPEARADVLAIYAFDHELGRAPRVATSPLLGEMRLVWWREALDEILEGRAVRRHPTAQALQRAIERRTLPKTSFEAMIDARYRELDPTPMDAADALAWARDSAGVAAVLAASILDASGDPQAARGAGAIWALRRRTGDGERQAGRDLAPAAKRDVRRLSAASFPAAAHAVLAPGDSELGRRLKITWAVARGRI